MQFTTALVAALGLLSSITVALPTSGDGLVSESTGLKARSADPLGPQGSIMNGHVPKPGPHELGGDPRADPNYRDDKQRRSADPLGPQGSIMNGHVPHPGPHELGGDPRADPNYRDDKQRRSADPAGPQGSIMNYHHKPPHGDKQRRSVDTTAEIASANPFGLNWNHRTPPHFDN